MTEENRPLFSPEDFPEIIRPAFESPSLRPLPFPIWTENKARLIERYLYYFVLITKHGTYIDAFAGQQKELPGMWAAKLVLESQPRWLRRIHLIELDRKKIPSLNTLKAEQDAQPVKPPRQVEVYEGDCNAIVPEILRTGSIGPKEATFCLLDQRTFECQWATLRALAEYKPTGQHKIELFYFLPIGWLDRAFAATTKNTDMIERWWGRPDWESLRPLNARQRVEQFERRFREELAYRSVLSWPIYENEEARRVMYFMVHATDHPEAPKLMRRAYVRAVQPLEPTEQLTLEWESGAFDSEV